MIGDPESILGPEDGAAYRRFLDWSLGAGFDLAIVKVTMPAKRKTLIAWTKEQVPAACEIDLMQVGPNRSRLWDLLNRAVNEQGATMLIAHGLEQAAAPARILAQLNVERDELVKAFAMPWILFVHPAVYPELVHKAPDFVDFAGLWLEEVPVEAPSTLPLATPPAQADVAVEIADESSGKKDLLPAAAKAIRLGHLDEARDLLAQYDLKKPDMQDEPDGVLAQCLRAFADNRLEEALRLLREEWRPAVERMEPWRAVTIAYVAGILGQRGELDEALRILREKVLPVIARSEDGRVWAIAQAQVADILQLRGELDEALRIYREEVLPVIERLGDLHLRAIAQGKVADILFMRRDFVEALRIYQEEELPVHERLGDVRGQAITLGKVADILSAYGELDESLRIRREEELPAYERLGDVRSRAIAQGKVANILQSRGELDEASRIWRQEVLPEVERLGEVPLVLVGRANLALTLAQRGRPEDAPEIAQLLALAIADARRLRVPEVQQIETIVRSIGLDPNAPPFV